MRSKAKLNFQAIREDSPNARRLIKSIEEYQLSLIAPQNFDPTDPDNAIKASDLAFENLCTSLEELGVNNPSELSVFRFYSKIQYFKSKKLKQEKATRHGKNRKN